MSTENMSDVENTRALTRREWDILAADLQAPFDPEDVLFRVQSQPSDGGTRGSIVAYVRAATIGQRLDDAAGPGCWAFDFDDLLTEQRNGKTALVIARGKITIHGVTKCNIADAPDTEPTKGVVSEAEKRAGAEWGIGRYLRKVGIEWVDLEKAGKSWRIPPSVVKEQRAKLPKPYARADLLRRILTLCQDNGLEVPTLWNLSVGGLLVTGKELAAQVEEAKLRAEYGLTDAQPKAS